MFISNDSIKFMMAKIFFTLAEFKNYTIKNNISYSYHGRDTIDLNYIVNGSGKVKINDNIYKLKTNDYFVIPEFVPCTIISNEEMEIYSVYFSIDKARGFSEYVSFLSKTYINHDNDDIKELLKSIHEELMIKTIGYNEVVTSTFKSIIVKIVRNEGLNEKRLSHYSLDSLQFSIDKIITNEFATITISELATRLGMSVRDLQRYLLKNYNKCFSDLKKDYKLEYAKIRLEYYDDSIEKKSEDLNFSSREHFCYFFKKETNETPLGYRKRKKMTN